MKTFEEFLLIEDAYQVVGMLGSHFHAAGGETVVHKPSGSHFRIRQLDKNHWGVHHIDAKKSSAGEMVAGRVDSLKRAADSIIGHLSVIGRRAVTA